MAGLWDRLFGSDDAEEQEEQTGPRFHDFDQDDPWGKQPEPEPREKTDTGDTLFHEFDRDDPFGRIYYPLDDDGKIFNPLASPQPEASTGNLTFVQYAPPEEPPPSPAPRPREISLWGIDNPYRDAQDWQYEALRWPADGEADQYQTAPPQPEMPQVELPDIPEVPEVTVPELEIALVVGFEETATSGQINLYYQPTQNTEHNEHNEEDDELT